MSASNVSAIFNQSSEKVIIYSFGGITTTITCTEPISFNFKLGLSTSGKIVNVETGSVISLPGKCTKDVVDTVSRTMIKCDENNKCKFIDLKNGNSKDVSMEPTDSGLEQLAAETGRSVLDLLGGPLIAGGGSGGDGYTGSGDYHEGPVWGGNFSGGGGGTRKPGGYWRDIPTDSPGQPVGLVSDPNLDHHTGIVIVGNPQPSSDMEVF